MGAQRSNQSNHHPRRTAHRTALRTLPVLLLAALAMGGVTACDPVGSLNSAAVAVTTEQTATAALAHEHVDVKWLTCNANLNSGPSATPSAAGGPRQVADVSCRGETKDGRPITVKGKVTQEVEGRCVKGDLTAKVAGRTVFRASVLGNCTAPAPTTGPATPAPGGRPTVTVTATVTVTQSFQGK
ncbi:hypothetical protein [Streptomyces xanthochromogenes]|uniref:Lipoprotein n=1 Tax=Streptomyces xanthochromogenes TaxID=67384 RepID=A0ABQ2ZVD6_9ACTN|nr:hypothetical protein [Streptomyces xanthochromogenes]GGY23621.1 hypothetical protein GCM10010326_16500 [Streptomyces xanthochromogenes]